MHQRIIQDVIKNLDDERSRYFGGVLASLGNDPRADLVPNLLYAVLKEVVLTAPPYLPTNQFNNMLFAFVGENIQKITSLMYSSQYITDSTVLQKITNEFVELVVETTYQLHQQGNLETGEHKKRSFSWPYDNADFPFAD